MNLPIVGVAMVPTIFFLHLNTPEMPGTVLQKLGRLDWTHVILKLFDAPG
jgi:hypothetical protein